MKPGKAVKPGGKGKAVFKVKNKVQNKQKRQRFRNESQERRTTEAAAATASDERLGATASVRSLWFSFHCSRGFLELVLLSHAVKILWRSFALFILIYFIYDALTLHLAILLRDDAEWQ